MSYVDVIYDASCGIQLFCGIALISANRLNKKRRILCMLLVMFMYIFIDSVMVYGGDLIGSMVAVMEMLMFPVIADFYEKAKKHDIVIESSIAPLTKDERDIQEIIGAISDVLDKALSYSVKAKAPRWINIAIRRKNKMLAINVEFSKKTGSYLSRDNYEFKYLRAFVDKASGALLVTNKKEMVQISIII